MMKLEYGNALIIYGFGSVDCADTIDRLTAAISNMANENIRFWKFVLKEKLMDMDDEDWALLFPKILRNMAVYLDCEQRKSSKHFRKRRSR